MEVLGLHAHYITHSDTRKRTSFSRHEYSDIDEMSNNFFQIETGLEIAENLESTRISLHYNNDNAYTFIVSDKDKYEVLFLILGRMILFKCVVSSEKLQYTQNFPSSIQPSHEITELHSDDTRDRLGRDKQGRYETVMQQVQQQQRESKQQQNDRNEENACDSDYEIGEQEHTNYRQNISSKHHLTRQSDFPRVFSGNVGANHVQANALEDYEVFGSNVETPANYNYSPIVLERTVDVEFVLRGGTLIKHVSRKRGAVHDRFFIMRESGHIEWGHSRYKLRRRGKHVIRHTIDELLSDMYI